MKLIRLISGIGYLLLWNRHLTYKSGLDILRDIRMDCGIAFYARKALYMANEIGEMEKDPAEKLKVNYIPVKFQRLLPISQIQRQLCLEMKADMVFYSGS